MLRLHVSEEAAMRKLAAGIVIITASGILSGCATFQKYPAFSAQPGGRIVTADRSGVTNLLPASRSMPPSRLAPPTTYGEPVH
jgi:hypothetical protein